MKKKYTLSFRIQLLKRVFNYLAYGLYILSILAQMPLQSFAQTPLGGLPCEGTTIVSPALLPLLPRPPILSDAKLEDLELKEIKGKIRKMRNQLIAFGRAQIEPILDFELSPEDQKSPIYVKDGYSKADRKRISLNSWPHVLMWSLGASPKRTLSWEEMKNLMGDFKNFTMLIEPFNGRPDWLLTQMGQFDKEFNSRSKSHDDLVKSIQEFKEQVAKLESEVLELEETYSNKKQEINKKRDQLIFSMRRVRTESVKRGEKEVITIEENVKAISIWEEELASAFIRDFENSIQEGQIKKIPDFLTPGNGIKSRIVNFIVKVAKQSQKFSPEDRLAVFTVLDIAGVNGLPLKEMKEKLKEIITGGTGKKYELLCTPLLNRLESDLKQVFKKYF